MQAPSAAALNCRSTIPAEFVFYDGDGPQPYVPEPGRIRVGATAEIGDFWTLPRSGALAGQR